MKRNPKYRFIEKPNLTIAISTFAGKPVKGMAKCNPDDHYDEAYGRALAVARCNLKVASRRVKSAIQKHDAAYNKLIAALKEFDNVTDYKNRAYAAYNEAVEELNYIESIKR